MIGVVVTPTMHKEVFDSCKKNNIKVGDFLRGAITEALKNAGK